MRIRKGWSLDTALVRNAVGIARTSCVYLQKMVHLRLAAYTKSTLDLTWDSEIQPMDSHGVPTGLLRS